MVIEERRRDQRVDIAFPLECSKLSEKKYFYTVGKDLSTNGVKIISEEFLPKDNRLMVTINLVDRVLNLQAKVAWCNKLRIAERYHAGLEFLDVDKENQRSISRFLNKILS